jgi:hypothetical protein
MRKLKTISYRSTDFKDFKGTISYAVTPATDSAAAQLRARRSSTFPSLWWSNLHDFKPKSINVAQGIDLGLQLGLEGLGLRDPRLGAADIAGERRSRGMGGSWATTSSA